MSPFKSLETRSGNSPSGSLTEQRIGRDGGSLGVEVGSY